jgi:hypothetical protein
MKNQFLDMEADEQPGADPAAGEGGGNKIEDMLRASNGGRARTLRAPASATAGGS